MVAPAVTRRVAAIDMGTNSTRLLVSDGDGHDVARESVVTGLGREIVRTGRLSAEGREATLATLERFSRQIESSGVEATRAVITAVGRDAEDIVEFLSEAARIIGVDPEVIGGDEEARLSYRGAVAELSAGPWIVVDIGGGSTEMVAADTRVSIGIGSVKVTDLHLASRPVTPSDLGSAQNWAREALTGQLASTGEVVGVAGTWTTLGAMELALSGGGTLHGMSLPKPAVEAWVLRLADLTVEETARLDGLDPARAPVILGGALIAEAALGALGVEAARVSERDLLDGVVAGLLSGNRALRRAGGCV